MQHLMVIAGVNTLDSKWLSITQGVPAPTRKSNQLVGQEDMKGKKIKT